MLLFSGGIGNSDILRQPDSIRLLRCLNRPANPKIRTHTDVEGTLRPAERRNVVKLSNGIIFLIILVMAGCKGCDKETVPPQEVPVSASFGFFDQVGDYGMPVGDPNSRLYETDTFYLTKFGDYEPVRVNFIAADTSVETYGWTVGEDPRPFTKKKFFLYFSSPGSYRVKLKVSRKARDGKLLVDSSSRNFRIIQKEFHPILGRYRGYNTSKPDSLFTLYIGHGSANLWGWQMDTLQQTSGLGPVMIGLQGRKIFTAGLQISSLGAWADDVSGQSPQYGGNFALYNVFVLFSKSYDSVFVDYTKRLSATTSDEPVAPYINDKFIGKRIQ